MFAFTITSLAYSLLFNSYASITLFMRNYGYLAIFVLMAMESSSIPVPSEVVLPLAGFFAAKGLISFPIALLVGIAGSVLGSLIDYGIGYFIGKEMVYKHLKVFHITKERLDGFDRWFEKNGIASVFLTRLVPVARTIINFPAGFARMDMRKFLGYSLAGIFIWDLVLMLFGYYALTVNNAVIVLGAIGVFAIALYVVYRLAEKRMRA